MRTILACGIFLTLSGTSLFAAPVTINLFPDASAAPGTEFNWQFTLTNDTGFYLAPSGVDSTFPASDGVAGQDPPVQLTDNLDAFYDEYPDGLPDGSTSIELPFASYLIDPGATPGAQVGNSSGPCCILTLSYDLYGGAGFSDYDSSSSVDSDFTAVVVSGSEGFSNAPEPASLVTCLLGLAAFAAVLSQRRRATLRLRIQPR
jgi:hypothetical protein